MLPTPPLPPAPPEVPPDPRGTKGKAQKHPQPVLGAPCLAAACWEHPRAPGRRQQGSLAAVGHVPEELLPLLVAEALQAVRALKVPLASLGRSRAPALCGEFWPLGSRPRPPATGCHELRSVSL